MQYYIHLTILNNTNYINSDINNNSDNNNKHKTSVGCNNNVCKVKSNGYNVDDVRLIQLITKLLVLTTVNVVIIWIFVNSMFEISIYALVSLALELFELVLSNICLWLMFDFDGKYCI